MVLGGQPPGRVGRRGIFLFFEHLYKKLSTQEIPDILTSYMNRTLNKVIKNRIK